MLLEQVLTSIDSSTRNETKVEDNARAREPAAVDRRRHPRKEPPINNGE